jgi:large subunit ribosomal protein L3
MRFLKKLIGKKCGMTQLFDENGVLIPCTVLLVEPNQVTQIKTPEIDGYHAVQIAGVEATGSQQAQERKTRQPLSGHFKKANAKFFQHVIESRSEEPLSYTLGETLTVDQFNGVNFVDVVGTTKGKGYQGMMKLRGFAGGPASHGSGFHRHAGSTGMRSSPGRSLPNSPRPSQMGNRRQTVQNIKVIAIHPEKNLIVLKGQVPGCVGATVVIQEAVKKTVGAK